MKIVNTLLIAVACIGAANRAGAQAIEYGVFGGTSNYLGDLVEKSIDLQKTKLAGGGFFRYNLSANFSFRATATYGVLAGTDANAVDKERRWRNLSFETPITEGALLFEYSPIGFNPSHGRNRKICPFIFVGLGVFHFNPTAEYNGKWYALHDLSTEGQGLPEYPTKTPYKLTQMSYPFGLGARYNVSRHWNVGIEFRFGKTFTDYLDDVSGTYADPDLLLAHRGPTAVALADRRVELGRPPVSDFSIPRGNVADKDWYIFSGFTLAYMPHAWKCYNF
jgi:opacity protein-like surface antigen